MSEQRELIFMGKVCSHCGKESAKMTEVQGKLLCDYCLNSLYFYCSKCKVYKPKNSRRSIRDSGGYGKVVCITCFEDFFTPCEHCGYGCKKADGRRWDNHNYCNNCYDNMFVCSSCNQRLFKENHYDAGLCRHCWEDERKAINQDHLAKAPLDFQGKGPNFYGIELEVETDERLDRRTVYAKKILKLFGRFVIIKHDGSIVDKNGRNVGFEIVTVPASQEVQKEKWNDFFNNLPKGMRSYDTSTCGLHIHCSRKPLTPLTIAKMLLFMNSRDNLPFIKVIAGRDANKYCKIQDKTYKDASPRLPHDRYEALNLANAATVEFRIFRGTLKRESLFKSLEFCAALVQFCSFGSNYYSIKDCRKVDKFLEYVKLHKKDYLHLWAFICARWFSEESKLTQIMGFPLPDKPAEVEEYNHEPNPEIRNNVEIHPGFAGNPFNGNF